MRRDFLTRMQGVIHQRRRVISELQMAVPNDRAGTLTDDTISKVSWPGLQGPGMSEWQLLSRTFGHPCDTPQQIQRVEYLCSWAALRQAQYSFSLPHGLTWIKGLVRRGTRAHSLPSRAWFER